MKKEIAMKLTDEMVEKVVLGAEREAGHMLPLPGANGTRRILTAYHKILSTQEPPEELVERVATEIYRAACTESLPDGGMKVLNIDTVKAARAAIRAIFGGE